MVLGSRRPGHPNSDPLRQGWTSRPPSDFTQSYVMERVAVPIVTTSILPPSSGILLRVIFGVIPPMISRISTTRSRKTARIPARVATVAAASFVATQELAGDREAHEIRTDACWTNLGRPGASGNPPGRGPPCLSHALPAASVVVPKRTALRKPLVKVSASSGASGETGTCRRRGSCGGR